MIKPSVGRVMWYWPHKDDRGDQPLCALVTYVHGEHMVNLSVFDHDGSQRGETSVPVVQDGSPYAAGESPFCEWMPYQLGQAKRTEAAEASKAG